MHKAKDVKEKLADRPDVRFEIELKYRVATYKLATRDVFVHAHLKLATVMKVEAVGKGVPYLVFEPWVFGATTASGPNIPSELLEYYINGICGVGCTTFFYNTTLTA